MGVIVKLDVFHGDGGCCADADADTVKTRMKRVLRRETLSLGGEEEDQCAIMLCTVCPEYTGNESKDGIGLGNQPHKYTHV